MDKMTAEEMRAYCRGYMAGLSEHARVAEEALGRAMAGLRQMQQGTEKWIKGMEGATEGVSQQTEEKKTNA